MRRLVVALMLAFVPLVATAQSGGRTLLVRLVTAAEGAPLGYGVVSLPAHGVERFTPASGAVALPVPEAGPVRLRARRLGFTPVDTTVVVGEGASTTVTVALARVSFTLDAVTVVAWPPCLTPGLSAADARVRAVVEQLQENAERYRLLVKQYPFVYTVRREFGEKGSDGSYIAQRTDMIPVEGRSEWSYRPGTLIAREPSRVPGGRPDWVMRIPGIADLAEASFIAQHCFHVAGVEEKGGERLLRLDIVAADALKDVDVNVEAWLDPEDYRLRHARFTLTRPPRQVRGLVRSTTAVEYREVIPFVPVVAVTTAENTVQQGRAAPRVSVERQRMERVLFQGPRPDSLQVPPPDGGGEGAGPGGAP